MAQDLDAEFIIVGCGAMGSAAAYHLAQAGRSVLAFEQFEIGHERGASHGESRIIRLSYDHPTYIKMARQSYDLWAHLEQESGEKLLFKTGMIDIGKPDHSALNACLKNMRQENVDYQLLSAEEIRQSYPQLRVQNEVIGVLQKDAGILSPRQCVPLLAKLARERGAQIVERAEILAIAAEAQCVLVETTAGRFRGRRIIVTGGPWSAVLLARLGVHLPITVTEESYIFVRPHNLEAFSPDKLPIFACYGETAHGPDLEFYGFPVFGRPGVKVARHHAGPKTTADQRSFVVSAETMDILRKYIRRLIPEADGELLHAMTCLYATTPDRHFIIDTLPEHKNIVLAAGFSGHGFKFAILIGKILADLAMEKRVPAVELFKLARFKQITASL